MLSVYACVVLEIILGDGGVESVEDLHSLCNIDFEFESVENLV